MIFVFIGPSGSGKTEIASRLAEKCGYKIAKSYTTRAKRSETEDNHYFITKAEYDRLPDKVIPVCYDGNYYCYTKEELENSDIIIAEPSAIDGLISSKVNFHVFFFDVDSEVRIARMTNRGDSSDNILKRLAEDGKSFFGIYEKLKKIGSFTNLRNLGSPEDTVKEVDVVIKRLKGKALFILLTDLDDVLENLTDVWLSLLSWLQRNNPDFIPKTIDDLDGWNLSEKFPMLTVDEVFEPLNTDLIWKQIRPLPGAVETIKKYNDMAGVEVRILTSSHYSAIAPKREFLRTYFPFINWNQVIITSEKQRVKGNVLVDDYQNNLIGGDYKGILFYRPHNRFFDASKYPNITRAADWDEADKIIYNMVEDYYR